MKIFPLFTNKIKSLEILPNGIKTGHSYFDTKLNIYSNRNVFITNEPIFI